MELLDYLRRLFSYDRWANREALVSLRAAPPSPRSLKLLAHIVAAEWLWLNRLRQEKQGMAVWPDLTLARCEAELAALEESWGAYLAALTSDRLTGTASYTNTKGESFATPVRDILMHVVMHSAYHRGQIASDVRAAGGTPAYTDFVHAVRKELVH